MEQLTRYLAENSITRAEFARRLSISPAYVSEILRTDAGKRKRPSLELAVRIEAATAGAVSVGDWVSHNSSTSEAPHAEERA